jgi:hypothetical protein
LRSRAAWSVLAFIPFLIVVSFRADAIAAQSNGWLTLNHALAWAAISIAVGVTCELRDLALWPTFVHVFAVGAASGAVFPAVQDLVLARLLLMAWMGVALGSLRYHWDVKRLSRQRTHTLGALVWNTVHRRIGITPFFALGEVVACCLLVDGGLSLAGDTGYGYLLVGAFPILFTALHAVATWVVQRLFGNVAAGHRNESETRAQLVVWVIIVVASITIIAGSILAFVWSYLPYVWSRQALMGFYAIPFEMLAYMSRRQAAKNEAARKAAAEGRQQKQRLYQAVLQQHGGNHAAAAATLAAFRERRAEFVESATASASG